MNDEQTPATVDLTRRRFLQAAALTGTAAFLAACGPSGASTGPSTAPTASASAGGRGGRRRGGGRDRRCAARPARGEERGSAREGCPLQETP